MNKTLQEDINKFSLDSSIINILQGKKIIITGSTGLIGSILVKCLNKLGIHIQFLLPVRNLKKAYLTFEGCLDNLNIIETDLVEYFANLQEKVNYVIHCASPTNGKYMTQHPLETFKLAIDTTNSILEYAQRVSCEGIVYLSSIEYYGEIKDGRLLDENMTGFVDHNSPRSSYPLGKQAAEFISYCYAKEYDVNVKIARLTQTLGPGVSESDNRVFMQFARSILKGEDIELHTMGKSAKSYCYTIDCVKAILYILIYGEKGEAYNVANPDTYISIKELAEFLRTEFNPKISIKIDLNKNIGYAPETHINLSVDKLFKLGWKPEHDLKSMFNRLLCSLKDN